MNLFTGEKLLILKAIPRKKCKLVIYKYLYTGRSNTCTRWKVEHMEVEATRTDLLVPFPSTSEESIQDYMEKNLKSNPNYDF
jgi:hypothetical protein